MTTEERVEMLDEAMELLGEAAALVEYATRGTRAQGQAEAYVLPTLRFSNPYDVSPATLRETLALEL